ncbi:hypothetical protein ACFYZJ_20230 [Streptomyces sp. NPDC001848]|uniref:hypothetical protein n=1 Tax=Streptomyces sp. NPDC001848 TaxID=3364618 RepID=UPI0036AEEE52
MTPWRRPPSTFRTLRVAVLPPVLTTTAVCALYGISACALASAEGSRPVYGIRAATHSTGAVRQARSDVPFPSRYVTRIAYPAPESIARPTAATQTPPASPTHGSAPQRTPSGPPTHASALERTPSTPPTHASAPSAQRTQTSAAGRTATAVPVRSVPPAEAPARKAPASGTAADGPAAPPHTASAIPTRGFPAAHSAFTPLTGTAPPGPEMPQGHDRSHHHDRPQGHDRPHRHDQPQGSQDHQSQDAAESPAPGRPVDDPPSTDPSPDSSRAGSWAGEGRERPGRPDVEPPDEDDGPAYTDQDPPSPPERIPDPADRETAAPATGIEPSRDAADPVEASPSPSHGAAGSARETSASQPTADVLPLGSGLVLVGLGLALTLLALRLRRG